MVNNIKIGKKIIVLTVLVFVFLPVFAQAVSWWPLVPCGLNEPTAQDIAAGKVKLDPSYYQPCNQCELLHLGKNILDFTLVGLMPPVAAILFVWGGFLILMGGAIPANISKGQSIFWNTAIGVAIILASWLITNTIIRSIAADNVASEWWKFECRVTIPAQQPPTKPPVPGPEEPPVGGNCTGIQCSDSNLNICGQNTSANCSESAVNRWDSQIRAAAANNQIGSGIDTVALVKAVMSQESSGRTDLTASDGLSYGIMQLRPTTADSFKSGCTSANITPAWLNDSNNVQASVCIAINFLKSLVSSCGTSVRNLAAGYNGGGAAKGACDASQSCASCSACGSEQTRRWECLWDGPDGEHKVCNVDRAGSSFNATRKYVPKVSYCYGKFGGSTIGGGGSGTGSLTLASIEPSIFPAGTEKSFNQETGVVEYTYLDVPFEIKGSNLTGTTLSSSNIGVDGKPGIEFKNLQTTSTSIKGTMLMYSTAKDGNTKITVKNSTSSADTTVRVTVTGTQYLKRKFADNPKVSFRGNWKETIPNQTVSNIENSINRGIGAISANSYKQLNMDVIIYEEKFFDDKSICGRPPPDAVYNGCASPKDKIIDIKARTDVPQQIAEAILHEAAHKLQFFNLGFYMGVPNAPTTASNFQKEWDALNIVTPANTSACPQMPLKDSVTWKDGTTDSPYCVFFRAYGASLLSGDTLFYEDPTTMAESHFVSKTLTDPRHRDKINLLKKYGFLP